MSSEKIGIASFWEDFGAKPPGQLLGYPWKPWGYAYPLTTWDPVGLPIDPWDLVAHPITPWYNSRTYLGQFGLFNQFWQMEAAKLTREAPKYNPYWYLLDSEGRQSRMQFSILYESCTWLITIISEKIFLTAPTANFAKIGKPGQWLRDSCGWQATIHSFP